MKKILLSSIALGTCLLMVGCGTSAEDAAITNLSNQIDRLNNVISNSSVVSTSNFDFSNYENENSTGIRNIYQRASSAISKQESYKEQIKTKTAMIKNALSAKGLKLGKNTNAIRELANSLSKYTTKLTNTNNEYRRTASSLSKMKANSSSNTSDIGAKLTRLSSCCDSRICYYNNLLNTLNQIQEILNGGAIVDENGNLNNDYLNNYLPEAFNNNYNANNCDNGNCCPNGNCLPNQGYYQNNLVNQQGYHGYGNMPRNGYYNSNMPYGYRNNAFNPNRNTDTYGPGITNIDTYRSYGYGYNGFGGNGLNEISDEKEDEVIETEETQITPDLKDETTIEETEKIDTLVHKSTTNQRDPDVMPKSTDKELKLSPDYQKTNETIKDLIQSSAPVTQDFSENMMVL